MSAAYNTFKLSDQWIRIENAIKTRWDVFAVAVQLERANRPQACFRHLVTCNL